jgi:hypothetical protein
MPLVGEEHRTYRWGGDPTRNQRRLTVHDAARSLGITEDAVRMRIKRGTLSADKEGGRLYVLLDNEPTPDPTGRADELVEELRDRVRYLERQVEEERNARFRADQLLARLMERVPDLESPAPPESPEPREEPETSPVRPERTEPAEPVDPQREESNRVQPERVELRESPESPGPSDTPAERSGSPQTASKHPWRKRMFGG